MIGAVQRAGLATPSGLVARWSSRGGKIDSLLDGTGREWLSQTVTPRPSAGAGFGAAEMAGWDECAPTLARCTVDTVELPDHGDLWDATWRLEGAIASAEGTALPYRLERTASVNARGGLRLGYTALATAGELPFLWSAHPQFSVDAGSLVRLGREPDEVEEHFPGPRRAVSWNEAVAAVAPGAGRKVFLDSARAGWRADLVHADGATLTMRWSGTCRHLGVWIDRSLYAHRDVLAIEPTTAPSDSLEHAVGSGGHTVLRPGEPLRWWIDLDVSA